MTELSPAEQEEIREAFDLFDKDKDGKLNADELASTLRALGQNPSQLEVKELFAKTPMNFADFLSLMKKRHKPTDNEDQLRQAFKIFDQHNTGYVQIAELRHVLVSVGEKLSKEEVDGVLKDADSDNDGKINLQDFLRVMKSAK